MSVDGMLGEGEGGFELGERKWEGGIGQYPRQGEGMQREFWEVRAGTDSKYLCFYLFNNKK